MPLPALPALGMLLPAKLKRVLLLTGLVLFVAAMSLTLGYCEGKKAGEAGMQAALDRANLEAAQQKARADEAAAARRLADQRATDNLERNLADAVRDIPDTVPNARRLARACAQLRSQGADTSRLPQCGGSSR